MIQAFDAHWVYYLNGWMTQPGLARVFTCIAVWGVLYFILVALWLWYAPSNARTALRHKRAVMMIALAALVALLVVNIFDVVTPRPRPFVALDHIVAVNVLTDPASFPSLHVTMAFCFATMLLLLRYKTLGWVSMVVAVLIGLSRVIVGVHYPTDIFGGVIVGVVAAVAIYYEASWIRDYLPSNTPK